MTGHDDGGWQAGVPGRRLAAAAQPRRVKVRPDGPEAGARQAGQPAAVPQAGPEVPAAVRVERAQPAGLPDGKLALLRQVLGERIASASGQVSRLGAEIREVTLAQRDTPADDEHDPEGSTVSVERERDVALLGSAQNRLSQLLAAQARLDAGTFGICERCGGPIPFERLQVRPEVRFCVPCVRLNRS